MIDKTAIIHTKAKIGNNVTIGAYSIIGPDAEIGDNTWIGPHVVIDGITKIGKNNKIFQFAAIGADPQDKKYKGEPTTVEIGDGNLIREFCTIHRGTAQGHSTTKIGDNNMLMNYVHIAHDCTLGNNTVFANYAALSGHVSVGNFVVVSGFAKVLQFCSIGDYAFVAGATDIVRDVLPFTLVSGYYNNVKAYGLNIVGLKRNGFSDEKIRLLKRAYSIIYRKGYNSKQILVELEKMLPECSEIQMLIDVLKKTKRGIVK